MTREKLSIALATVAEIRRQADAGNEPLARSARKTLNELCCQWADDLGAMSYPAPVRDALRDANLSERA